MPLTGAPRWVLVGVTVGTLALSACAAHPDTPKTIEGWHQIALPEGMLPSSLLITEDAVLVGGLRLAGGDRSPALASLPIDGTYVDPSAVRLTPTTPYGKVADLTALTGSGDSVVAVGAAQGGAHANFRWTIWTGTTTRVVDRPQTFETFGGWEAGTLLGAATDTQGSLVVGTWQGRYGLDGAIWRADGERWVRQPAPAALANTADRQVGPRTVDQQSDGSVIIAGAVIDLVDGVQQAAAYWRDVDGNWSLTKLADPGKRSEAWSTGCAATCWSVGSRDGAVALWSGDARAAIPTLGANDTDSGRVLLSGDYTLVTFSTAGSGRLLIGRDGTWRLYTAPDGRILAAGLSGSRLYLVLSTTDSNRLMVVDLADVLGG